MELGKRETFRGLSSQTGLDQTYEQSVKTQTDAVKINSQVQSFFCAPKSFWPSCTRSGSGFGSGSIGLGPVVPFQVWVHTGCSPSPAVGLVASGPFAVQVHTYPRSCCTLQSQNHWTHKWTWTTTIPRLQPDLKLDLDHNWTAIGPTARTMVNSGGHIPIAFGQTGRSDRNENLWLKPAYCAAARATVWHLLCSLQESPGPPELQSTLAQGRRRPKVWACLTKRERHARYLGPFASS